MKVIGKSILIFTIFIFNCKTGMSLPNNDEKIVPSLSAYATPLGKELAKKYEDKLYQIVKKIRGKINLQEIEFVPRKGIGFFKCVYPYHYAEGDEPKEGYVFDDFCFGSINEGIKGNYLGVNMRFKNKSLALEMEHKEPLLPYFVRCSVYILNLFGKDVLEILMGERDILKDDNVVGAAFSVEWERGESHVSDYIEVYIQKKDIENYMGKKITFLDLLETSRIYAWDWDHGLGYIQKDVAKNLGLWGKFSPSPEKK